MELFIKIFRIVFRIILPYHVEIQKSFENFLLPAPPERWDAEIEFIQGCERAEKTLDNPVCEDDQMLFYTHGEKVLCVAKGKVSCPMAYTDCDVAASQLKCYLNTADYPPLQSLGALLQLVPLKWFLSRKGILLFHASQIVTDSKTVIFTAPSETGKTTQARLWSKHRGAEIVCNDRVLVRGMRTCGFPYDGGEPIYNPEEHGLHAIVCLGQSPRNEVARLRPAAAMARLMESVLFDAWDPQVRDFAAEQLLEIVSNIPVYQLNCTPDEGAVFCLENQLRKDGVIK